MSLGFEHCPGWAPGKIGKLIGKIMFGIKKPQNNVTGGKRGHGRAVRSRAAGKGKR